MRRKHGKGRVVPAMTAAALSLAMAFSVVPGVDSVKAAGETETAVEYTAAGKMRNVMYYGDWSIWGGQGNFYPDGIPADQLTHLNFAFVDFDASGNLAFTDKDAALGAPVGMAGVQWNSANSGILSAFQKLRAENPNLRIGVSLGGWSKSGDFSDMAASDSARANFVQNVCKFVKYNNMDFVDLDWEYPGENQYRDPDLCDNKNDEGTTKACAADKENYIKLLQDLRKALDKQAEEMGRVYELTVALPAPKAKLDDGIDIEKLFKIVDFANIMTYDMRGAWDEYSGHQTGLYTNPEDPYADAGLSVDASVQYLLSKGAPADKVVIGCAFYTRGWGKVSAGNNAALPGLFGEAAICTKDADEAPSRGGVNEAPLKDGEGGRNGGVWSYRSIDKLKSNYPNMKEYWDDVAKAPYMYDETTGVFFTYDNQRSIQEKAAYVKEHKLGGIISWMASQDAETGNGKRDELTKTIKQGLFGNDGLPTYRISNSALDVTVTVETFEEEWTKSQGYTIIIKNNATANESGEVLQLSETAGETIKMPKVYIKTKSGATLKASGYGAGIVTNENGMTTVDLTSVYDNQTIGQGKTCTFQLSSSNPADIADIQSIELAQRIVSGGVEISRQVVYGSLDNNTPDQEVKPDPDETPEPDQQVQEYSNTQIYTAGDVVTYQRQTYVCKWWTQGIAPGSAGSPWELKI